MGEVIDDPADVTYFYETYQPSVVECTIKRHHGSRDPLDMTGIETSIEEEVT